MELSQMELSRVARHEAAHFVVAWAVECPAIQVDTYPKGDELGRNGGFYGDELGFEEAVISLAGPVSDNWDTGSDKILEVDADQVKHATEDVAGVYEHGHDYQKDWYDAMRCLAYMGVDITDPAQVRDALLLLLDAVRAILKTCEPQWQEVTNHLIAHRRIGFYENGRPDQGEDAESFFFRWSDNWGVPPDEIRACVEKFRTAVNETIAKADAAGRRLTR